MHDSVKEESLSKYRAALDKKHWCPYCVEWYEDELTERASKCPKCKAGSFDRMFKAHRDNQAMKDKEIRDLAWKEHKAKTHSP